MQESKKSWKHKIYSGREQEQALEFVLRPLPVLIASDLEWQPTPVLLPGKIPGMEEPGRLQSMWLQRVGHD